jgi:hypothetical protein
VKLDGLFRFSLGFTYCRTHDVGSYAKWKATDFGNKEMSIGFGQELDVPALISLRLQSMVQN